jgi:hypothetical protein
VGQRLCAVCGGHSRARGCLELLPLRGGGVRLRRTGIGNRNDAGDLGQGRVRLPLLQVERLREGPDLDRELRREGEERSRRCRPVRAEEVREAVSETRLRAPVTIGERVHDHAAAEGAARGLVAEDEPVATHHEDRFREHDLRPAGVAGTELVSAVEQDELAHDLGRPDVEAHPVVARDRTFRSRPDLHPGIEALGQTVEPRVAHDVSSSEVAPLDARQVDRHALAVPGVRDRLPMHLDAAYAGRLSARENADGLALAHDAGDRRPGDDDAVAANHEGPVDR